MTVVGKTAAEGEEEEEEGMMAPVASAAAAAAGEVEVVEVDKTALWSRMADSLAEGEGEGEGRTEAQEALQRGVGTALEKMN